MTHTLPTFHAANYSDRTFNWSHTVTYYQHDCSHGKLPSGRIYRNFARESK